MKRLKYILPLLFIYHQVTAQTFGEKEFYLLDSLNINELNLSDKKLLDSCLADFKRVKHDTSKIQALNGICSDLQHSVWVYYQEIQDSIIDIQLRKKQTPKNLKKLTLIKADALNNLGYAYRRQARIEEALLLYDKSLEIYKKYSIKDRQATCLNNIAALYDDQNEGENVLSLYREALKLRIELKKEDVIGDSYNNIAMVYSKRGDNDSALYFYEKALFFAKKAGSKGTEATIYNNIGSVLETKLKYNEALDYFFKSLKLSVELGRERKQAVTLHNISNTYRLKNDIKKSKEYALKSLSLGKKLGYPDDIKSPSGMLYELYKKENKFKEALQYYELFIQMQDSLINDKNKKAIIRQQTKNEFEKAEILKQQEAKELARLAQEQKQRRNNLQYSIILVIILFVFVLVLSLGFIKASSKTAEGLIFFAFLIFFEFLLVLFDPYIESLTGGAPAYKLIVNALLAAAIFPAHAFFERNLKRRLFISRHK